MFAQPLGVQFLSHSPPRRAHPQRSPATSTNVRLMARRLNERQARVVADGV